MQSTNSDARRARNAANHHFTEDGGQQPSPPPSPPSRSGARLRVLVLLSMGFTIGLLVRDLLLSAMGNADVNQDVGGGAIDASILQTFPMAADNTMHAKHDTKRQADIREADGEARRPFAVVAVTTAVPSLSSSPSSLMMLQCTDKAQHAASQWLYCTQPTAAAVNALEWRRATDDHAVGGKGMAGGEGRGGAVLSNNYCGFSSRVYSQYESRQEGERDGSERLRRLLARSTIIFQGDSTLRELAGLLVGQADVPGTLEKKDANKGLRTPKYFVKMGPESVLTRKLAKSTERQSGEEGIAATSSIVRADGATIPLARLVFRFDFLSSSLREALVNEPTLDVLPSSSTQRDGPAAAAAVGFFNYSAPPVQMTQQYYHRDKQWPQRQHSIVVVSIASHGAKHLVTEAEYSAADILGSGGDRSIVGGQGGMSVAGNTNNSRIGGDDAIFGLFVGAMEDYIVERVLGLEVQRGEGRRFEALRSEKRVRGGGAAAKAAAGPRGSSHEKEEVGRGDASTVPKEEMLIGRFISTRPSSSSSSPSSNNPLPRSTIFLVVGQYFECSAMPFAPNKHFRHMSPACADMQRIVYAVWSFWEARTMEALSAVRRHQHRRDNGSRAAPLTSSAELSPSWRDVLHPESSWRSLSTDQMRAIASAVFYMPPMYCHGEDTAVREAQRRQFAALSPSSSQRHHGVSPSQHPQHAEEAFQYEMSRPFCTRDGIHLRKKYLVHKLDAMLNILTHADECLSSGGLS